jgi:hypothetical protein
MFGWTRQEDGFLIKANAFVPGGAADRSNAADTSAPSQVDLAGMASPFPKAGDCSVKFIQVAAAEVNNPIGSTTKNRSRMPDSAGGALAEKMHPPFSLADERGQCSDFSKTLGATNLQVWGKPSESRLTIRPSVG